MPKTKTIFEIADEEAERRVERVLIDGSAELSLADLPIECLPKNLRTANTLVSLDVSDCAQLQDLAPLAGLTSLQSLQLRGCGQLQDLAPLAGLTSLRTLDLSFWSQLRDLTPLAGLTSLQSLHLRGCGQLQDLAPLAGLTSLQSLDLGSCEQLQGLAPLAGLTRLQSLDLSFWSQLRDLTPLAGLTSLLSLDLWGCGKLQDLAPVAGLTGLQSLNLSDCGQLEDLAPLARLTSLQSLYLRGRGQLQDLAPLACLIGLQSLDLRRCGQLRDLAQLAGLTGLLSLDLRACEQLQDLEQLAGFTSLQSLYLGYCGELQDLGPLASLTNLQTLDLGECDQLQDLAPLARLPSLQSLDLGGCRQLEDVRQLAGLTSLQSLDLGGCGHLQDLAPLAHLTSLQSLNLSGLKNLAPLAGLTSLQSLDLRGCGHLQDLAPLAHLTSLQSLNLSNCGLENLAPLAGLTGLQSLNLSGCAQLQDLLPLSGLTSLQALDLSGCRQVQDLVPLASLTGLQSLDLSYCRQVQDLAPLAGLTCLQSLRLSYCRNVQDLAPLAGLTRLQSFRFLGCLLDCSPASQPLCSWPLLSKLYADRMVGAPSELGSKIGPDSCLPRIRAWQKDLLAGEAPNSVLKVLILGNGRVGKTQICRRLLGLEFDPSIPSTHGIAVQELQLASSREDTPEVRAKLWDFGGQSIYMGTHGLFLDDRAIYIIAWEPRYESPGETELGGTVMVNRPLTYWLEYIRSIAGPRAPVIVTQTQCDRESDVRIPPLPATHGFERLRTTYSSASQPDGMERLQMELKSAARFQLEQYGKVRLPLRWCSIARELDSRRQEKTISYSEFETLSRTKHNAAVPSAVLQYLHRSGQVFYRPGAFDNRVVLDLEWALDGIYAVLDRTRAYPLIRVQAGRFSKQLLAALVWQKYGPPEHELFLSLMQQCQICFKIADDLYVAPALLPGESESRAGIYQVWRAATPDVAAELRYSFLHEGVLRAMLCSLGQKAGVSAVYWAYGICFYDLETKSTARIRSEFLSPNGQEPGGRILVESAGAQPFLLAQHLVRSIQQLNIGAPAEVLWTKGEPQREAATAANDSAKAGEPFAAVKPGQVPRLTGEPQPVYVSYAWGGASESLVDQIAARLPGQLRLIRDKEVLRPGNWISKFMQEIGRADCVLVVLSAQYLKSFYCMRELLYLYQSSLGVQKAFLEKLVPLTLEDVRFSRAVERAGHIHYWEAEEKKLDAALAGLDRLHIGDADRAEQLAIKDFAHRVSDMLSWVADTLMPRGPDLHTHGIDAAIDLILQRTNGPERAGSHRRDTIARG